MDRKQMMNLIAQMESSGGKNREHPEVNQGVQAGTKSVSSYGLMPNTIYELANRDKNFANSPIGQQILSTKGDSQALNKITQDQGNDDVTMNALMDDQQRRLSKQGVPEDQMEPAMVFAHRRGVSGAIKAQDNGGYMDDPYVKEYMGKKVANPIIDGDDPKKQAMLGALNSLANK